MVHRPQRQRSGSYSKGRRPLWLEIRGQQRLQFMHARLELHRQRVQRLATLIDSVDKQVRDRLDSLGGDEPGYDTSSRDLIRPVSHRSTRHQGLTDESDDEGEAVSKKTIETYFEDGEWKSRREGSTRAFSVGGTKEEQIAEGREAAQRDKVEHIIKNKDGRIGRRNSYGHDPNPPRDED